MDPEIRKCLEMFGEESDDATDALLAYLDERDKDKKQILFLVYKRLDRKRAELAQRLERLTKEKWGIK